MQRQQRVPDRCRERFPLSLSIDHMSMIADPPCGGGRGRNRGQLLVAEGGRGIVAQPTGRRDDGRRRCRQGYARNDEAQYERIAWTQTRLARGDDDAVTAPPAAITA